MLCFLNLLIFPKVPYLNETGGNYQPAPCRAATGAGEAAAHTTVKWLSVLSPTFEQIWVYLILLAINHELC